MSQNLSKAYDLVRQAGKILVEEAMESGSKESDSFFQGVAALVLAKGQIEKIINEREKQELNDEFNKALFRDPYHAGDRAEVPAGCGVDGRDSGAVHVSGETQAHEPKPQE